MIFTVINECTNKIDRLKESIINSVESLSIPIMVTCKYLTRRIIVFNSGDHLFVERIGYTHHGIYLMIEKRFII